MAKMIRLNEESREHLELLKEELNVENTKSKTLAFILADYARMKEENKILKNYVRIKEIKNKMK